MKDLLPVLPVLLAGIGALVCVVLLRRHGKRKRVAEAARVAADRAETRRREEERHGRRARDEAALDAPTVAIDPNPTGRHKAHPPAVPVPQSLRADLGQPVATLPPVSAPLPLRRAVPPPTPEMAGAEPAGEDWIPQVPVPDDAPTPFAPTWVPTPADPDHWKKVPADPDTPTIADAMTQPQLPDWVTGSFTQVIELAEFNRHRSLAEWARLNEQNGAAR